MVEGRALTPRLCKTRPPPIFVALQGRWVHSEGLLIKAHLTNTSSQKISHYFLGRS
jgi:hypothetical protein